MLTRAYRTMTEAERRASRRRLPLLAFRARSEARAGTVEIVTFHVSRVWTLISCLGHGCCPYTWLIDSGGEFVYFRSWDMLAFAGEDFPGNHVRVEVLPLTQHVVSAGASGPPVRALPLFELDRSWEVFDEPVSDFAVLPRTAVRIPAIT